jgi:hypothetical protein
VGHLEGKKRWNLTLLRVPPAHKRDIALFKLICPGGAIGGALYRYNGESIREMCPEAGRSLREPSPG